MKRGGYLLLLSLLGPRAGVSGSLQEPLDPTLHFEELVTGLVTPTTMAFIGPDDLLVLQRTDGRVLRVHDGVLGGAVLDLPVMFGPERGLLGITTDPDFANNGFVYLYYTASATAVDSDAERDLLGNRLVRYRWNGSALVEPSLVLAVPAGIAHASGVLAFGPDDKLYVIVGDAWFPWDKLQNNPDGANPDDRGVIFRINPDGTGVTDNPFYDASFPQFPMNRYFAYGIRNSFGIAFDPLSGALWETENGPWEYDELNRFPAGSNGGHAQIWGPDARDPQGVGDLWNYPGSTYRDPQFSWNSPVAPTALAFVASRKLGCAYEHDLLVSSFKCRTIEHFELDAARQSLMLTAPGLEDRVADNEGDVCSGEQSDLLFAVGPQSESDQTTDIKNGPDGLVYLLSYNFGTIRRLSPVPGAVPDADLDQVDDACDCAPADATAYAPPVEIPRLRLSGKAPTQLGWDAQAAVAGPGTSYTVASGELSALRADHGFASACALATRLSPASWIDGRPVPAGDGFYYLVRASNACSPGSYGDGSLRPDPRDALDAAELVSCP